MILIVGASGNLGCAVAWRFMDRNTPVRLLTRTPDKLYVMQKAGAEVVKGDLRDPASLKAACEGVDRVFTAAHAFDGHGRNASRYVDDIGNRSLIDAAREAGVEHFVFTSARGAHADHMVDFMRTKYRIEQYLQDSGLCFTILRPSAYMETWALLVGASIVQQGKTTIFGRGETPVNFVAAEDVARFAELALVDPSLQREVLDIGGPENLTMQEVVGIFERVTGKEARRSYVPPAIMRVMRVLVRPFNPVLSRMMTAALDMDENDSSFDASKLQARFPGPLTRLEDFVRLNYVAP